MAILLSNMEVVPGHKVTRHLALVQGNTVRAKHIGRDIMAGLKNIVGGELTGYTELLEDARSEATNRMIAEAEALGANAIVNIRYSTASIADSASELYAYGTAVLIEED